MTEPAHLSLCTGYGGLDIAAQHVFGGDLVAYSDIEPGPIKVMSHHYPNLPNLGDLKKIDWNSLPTIDILTAGYPCQPFSNAGKRLGTEDPRHLWPYIAYGVSIVRPRVLVLENVASHLRRGFDVVLRDLAALGYDVAWSIVSAAEAGSPHLRKRLYIVAGDSHQQSSLDIGGRDLRALTAYAVSQHERSLPAGDSSGEPESPARDGDRNFAWREYEVRIRLWESLLGVKAPYPAHIGPRGGIRVSGEFAEWLMGVPGRITSVPGLSLDDKLKLAGNGVVPQQAAYAIPKLYERLTG
jgi:DNA (cytosine-5)-methyltransferase 1